MIPASGLAPWAFAFALLLWSVFPLVWVLASRPRHRLDWLATVGASAALLTLAVMAGPWAYLSVWFRAVLPVTWLVAVLYSSRHRARLRARPRAPVAELSVTAIKLIVLLVCAWGIVLVARGGSYDGEPLDARFPLRSGTYYVLQGGHSPLTNPFHWSDPEQRYALDVVKLNRWGNRSSGIAPQALDQYVVYDDPVYSPCDGYVIAAVDGFADVEVGRPDPTYPAGNHVIVECDGARVLLAHLRRSSVQVLVGDAVTTRRLIGRVGNSGNTTEPHLHLSATRHAATPARNEEAVSLLFDGRFLTINSLVVSRDSPHPSSRKQETRP